jgi:hypothetical protein
LEGSIKVDRLVKHLLKYAGWFEISQVGT